jgi:hypothetical protein
MLPVWGRESEDIGSLFWDAPPKGRARIASVRLYARA